MKELINLGRQIAEARRKLGLTQEDLAGVTEMDRSYISEIENGRKNLSVMSLVRIAKAIHLTPGELLDSALSR